LKDVITEAESDGQTKTKSTGSVTSVLAARF
jgi:hypothetical protein